MSGVSLTSRFSYKNTVKLTLMDLAVLLSNLHIGARDNEVGFEDPDKTIEQIEIILNKTTLVPLDLVESTLWSCNLLNEKEKFFHPQDRSFNSFLLGIEFKIRKRFNKLRNYFEDTKEGKRYGDGKKHD